MLTRGVPNVVLVSGTVSFFDAMLIERTKTREGEEAATGEDREGKAGERGRQAYIRFTCR